TAEFNRNLIERLRTEGGAQIEPDAFRHEAFYNPKLGRIEMHLRAIRSQEFELGGDRHRIEENETIHTENSYKYSPAALEALCRGAGFDLVRYWTDPKEWFGVFLLKIHAPEVALARAAC